MRRNWIYFINPFDVLTKKNYTLALTISNKHLGALHGRLADPLFNSLYLAYLPVHEAFEDAYLSWHSKGGWRKGGTIQLKQLLQLLSKTKIQSWDISIQTVYRQGTPQYLKLMPHKRGPFQNGSKFDRVEAVKVLSLSIGNDAALAATKADVDSFYTVLEAAYTSQLVNKSVLKDSSNNVEKARKAMCIKQYENLGTLMAHFADDPAKASPYFSLEKIRHRSQVIFNKHIAAHSTAFIVEHTFAPGSRIKVTNKGNCDLDFYLTKSKDQHNGTLKVTVPALTKVVIEVKDLGDPDATFLHVNNPDEVQTGLFRLDIRG